MKRREFLKYASTLPFVGAFLPETHASVQSTSVEDISIYEPKSSDIWRICDDVHVEGGTIRYYRLFLRMDYARPRPGKIAWLMFQKSRNKERLFDEFTELLNNEKAEKPTFVPTGIATPTGKNNEFVIAVEVAAKSHFPQYHYPHLDWSRMHEDRIKITDYTDTNDLYAASVVLDNGHVDFQITTLDDGRGKVRVQDYKGLFAGDSYIDPLEKYLHHVAFRKQMENKGVTCLHAESWATEPVLHPSLGNPCNHTMLLDGSSQLCPGNWHESKSWTSVLMCHPTDSPLVSLFMPVDNVFDTPCPIQFGKDAVWYGVFA